MFDSNLVHMKYNIQYSIQNICYLQTGSDWWVEVYAEDEKKWLCIDCVRWRFNHPREIESDATAPLVYAVGFNNCEYNNY